MAEPLKIKAQVKFSISPQENLPLWCDLDRLAQDNFARRQRSLSRRFHVAAAIMAICGVEMGAKAFLGPTEEKGNNLLLGLGGVVCAAEAFRRGGRIARPDLLPLSQEGRENLEKEIVKKMAALLQPTTSIELQGQPFSPPEQRTPL